jgi:hypothetical protein
MSPGAPDGQAVVLDVAQLQALLAKTFNVGLDVGRGKEPVALVRLRLAKALVGVAEANALAAESIAIERGVGTQRAPLRARDRASRPRRRELHAPAQGSCARRSSGDDAGTCWSAQEAC